MNKALAGLISEILPEGRILFDEPMSAHTTFRTGGTADYFLMPENAGELAGLLSLFNDSGQEYLIIGNGSNLLVSDKGYRGAIIHIGSGLSEINAEGSEIHAGAGALLSKVTDAALKNSLTGAEFASGIPGTVGGAMVMNAGAYGGEMKDIVKSVEVLTGDGAIKSLSCDEMEFAYRRSAVREKGYTVLKAVFSLRNGEKKLIKDKMDELSRQRREKQPLEFASAGSTFKRPEGYFAGKLIMDAGLKGFKIGGAMVSEKHCGFVVNTGDASSDDIYRVIKEVQEKVYGLYNVKLEPEILMVGEF